MLSLSYLCVLQILEGGEITGWRTAAASVVATRHLHRGEKHVLAVLGAGVQAESHARALQHSFNFKEVTAQFSVAAAR